MEVQVNTGFLMPNSRKESDSHADYTGTWTDSDGVEFYLSAWSNVSKKTGAPYFKLKLGKAKGAAQSYQPAQPAPISKHSQAKANGYQTLGRELTDDDLPF